MSRSRRGVLGRHARELPPAIALAAVLLVVVVVAPSFFAAGTCATSL